MSFEEEETLNSREAFSQEENIAAAFNAINECLQALSKRIEQLETKIEEIPTPDKTYYKPKGYEDYLSYRQNLDLIYEKISKISENIPIEFIRPVTDQPLFNIPCRVKKSCRERPQIGETCLNTRELISLLWLTLTSYLKLCGKSMELWHSSQIIMLSLL